MIVQKDIMDHLQVLAELLCERQHYAHIVLVGGAALLLQTHARDSTADMDLDILVVKDMKTGFVTKKSACRTSRHNNLINDFAHKIYAITRARTVDIFYTCGREMEPVPPQPRPLMRYASFRDDKGAGLTASLATLEEEFCKKFERSSVLKDIVFHNPERTPQKNKLLVDAKDLLTLSSLVRMATVGDEASWLTPDEIRDARRRAALGLKAVTYRQYKI